MIKIIKNDGRCKSIKELSKCKYLLYTNDFRIGELYAKIRLKPIYYYIIGRIKGSFYP